MTGTTETEEFIITAPLQVNGVISIPKPVRKRLGLNVGDLVEAKLRKV